MLLNEAEIDLLDQTAKELYVRRMHGIRDMSRPEMEQVAKECFVKAECFINIRHAVVVKDENIPF